MCLRSFFLIYEIYFGRQSVFMFLKSVFCFSPKVYSVNARFSNHHIYFLFAFKNYQSTSLTSCEKRFSGANSEIDFKSSTTAVTAFSEAIFLQSSFFFTSA